MGFNVAVNVVLLIMQSMMIIRIMRFSIRNPCNIRSEFINICKINDS